jgi:hypothetical protein
METLYARSLYHKEPPGLQTKIAMNPTLIVSWWCTGFSLVAIFIRVAGRWIRVERLFREDKIMLYSVIPLLIRMALVHVVLIWGTNNTVTTGLTEIEIRHREIGSKIVLAARIFYAMFIWVAKWTILEFLKRTIGNTAGSWHKSYELGMRLIDVFLVLTFIAVVIATLAECQPFSEYSRVVPTAAPQCREGIAQLVTMGICDIITDLVLVFFPIPLVLASSMRMKRKISLILLFLLSLGLVGITAFRVPSTISRKSAQQYRSLLASLEILAASAVANAVIIGSFIRDRGVKKMKFRADSVGGDDSLHRTPTRSQSITVAHWGSDDDLVRDLGLSLHPTLQHRNSTADGAPRVAPTAMANQNASRDIESGGGLGQSGADWNFTNARRRVRDADEDEDSISSTLTDLKMKELPPRLEKQPSLGESAQSPTKMSFFDVGGLVSESKTGTPPNVSHNSSIKDLSTAIPPPSRSSSRFLTDVGGLLTSHRKEDGLSSLPPGTSNSARRSSNSASFRNFNRSGSMYNSAAPIAEDSKKASQHSPAQPASTSGGASGPDAMDLSDAGGLLG